MEVTVESFPLGMVPKKALGEFRLIHYLSFLQGMSVNDATPLELGMVPLAEDKTERPAGCGARPISTPAPG